MKIGSVTAEVTAGLRGCNAQCGNGKWPGNKSARADSSGTTLDATQWAANADFPFAHRFSRLAGLHPAQIAIHRGVLQHGGSTAFAQKLRPMPRGRNAFSLCGLPRPLKSIE